MSPAARCRMRWGLGPLVFAALVLLTGEPARPAPPAAASLTVFGASDLAFALQEIAPRFEEATGARVTLVLGSTGHLAVQIARGAPADLFFAANESFIDDLVARNVAVPETRALYAQGRIALVWRSALHPPLRGLPDLEGPGVRRIAIANPQHAPYGKAAEEALRASGLWDALRPRLVYGENVRQALQFVETGAVDAGIVALSVADVPAVRRLAIDPGLHGPLNQAVAVMRRSERPALALAFIRFVTGPAGRPIMKRYGFRLPGDF